MTEMISRETEAELRRRLGAASPTPWPLTGASKGPFIIGGEDMELCVTAVNALPALLDQIASDQEMREEAAKRLALGARTEVVGDGSPYIKITFHNRTEMQQFNDTLAKLRTAVPADQKGGDSNDASRIVALPASGESVQSGSGCVFCDLWLVPEARDGKLYHFPGGGRAIECTAVPAEERQS